MTAPRNLKGPKTVEGLVDDWVLTYIPEGLPYLAYTAELATKIEELQAEKVAKLEKQLKEARELARLGGWSK